MTTPHAKTAEEVAKAIVAKHLAVTQDSGTLERAIAAAIREAEERGRIAQIALDLPASLESEDRGNRLEAMIDRMIENNVNQGVVTLGGENGITRVAAPVGSILDDAGNVRRVRGELVTSEEGDVIADGARVYFPNENGNIVEWDVRGPGDHIPVGKFWTSREAALSAQGAKHE